MISSLSPKVSSFLWIVIKDVLIVGWSALAFVGALAATGWSGIESVEKFTPLLLGMFSIFMAFTTLTISLREGRERARIERDQSVRPLFVLNPRVYEDHVHHEMTYFHDGSGAQSRTGNCLFFAIENVGRGPAFNVDVFMLSRDAKFYRANFPVPRIKPDESMNIELVYTLPESEIEGLYLRAKDAFGNYVYSWHLIVDDAWNEDSFIVCRSDNVIFKNRAEQDEADRHFRTVPSTQPFFASDIDSNQLKN